MDDKEKEKWLPIWYQIGHKDIQTAKAQGWLTLRWSVTWLLGILGADATNALDTAVDDLLPLLSLIIGLCVGYYLYTLHGWAKRGRTTTNKIADNWPATIRATYGLMPRPFDPNYWTFLIFKWGILAVIVLATWNLHT